MRFPANVFEEVPLGRTRILTAGNRALYFFFLLGILYEDKRRTSEQHDLIFNNIYGLHTNAQFMQTSTLPRHYNGHVNTIDLLSAIISKTSFFLKNFLIRKIIKTSIRKNNRQIIRIWLLCVLCWSHYLFCFTIQLRIFLLFLRQATQPWYWQVIRYSLLAS